MQTCFQTPQDTEHTLASVNRGGDGGSVLNETRQQEVFPLWKFDLNVWQNMLWNMHILLHVAPASSSLLAHDGTSKNTSFM